MSIRPTRSSAELISVIIPTRDSPHLSACLRAMEPARRAGVEVIVVDDASTQPVLAPGVRVIRTNRHGGPAAARNLGAEAARGSILVFVDSDVVVGERTITDMACHCAMSSGPAAVQTVYTWEVPEQANFATRFMALLQHHNFTSVQEPDRFEGLSSYCVAIRRDAFESAGGFDASVRRATVEDDNLAHALLALGERIELHREIQVQHLAQYSVGSILRRMSRMASDKLWSIRKRPSRAAVAPSRSHHRPEFLLATALVPVVIVSLPLAPPLAAALAAVVLATHGPLLRAAHRHYGCVFTLGSGGMIFLLGASAAAGAVHGLLKI